MATIETLMGDDARRTETVLIEDIGRSQWEQDKDPETRLRVKKRRHFTAAGGSRTVLDVERTADGTIVMEEYEWTYEDDWTLLSVLADFYGDYEDPRAAAVLWMATAHKRPYKGGEDGFFWFCAGRIAEGIGDDVSDLPAQVYDQLEGFDLEQASQKRYKTFPEALMGACAAFLAAVEGGWKPEEVTT
jgi:hypothetical protein